MSGNLTEAKRGDMETRHKGSQEDRSPEHGKPTSQIPPAVTRLGAIKNVSQHGLTQHTQASCSASGALPQNTQVQPERAASVSHRKACCSLGFRPNIHKGGCLHPDLLLFLIQFEDVCEDTGAHQARVGLCEPGAALGISSMPRTHASYQR